MSPITLPPPATRTAPLSRPAAAVRAVRLVPVRVRHGRPGRLALRTTVALVLAEAAIHSGAGAAPAAGMLAGIITWHLLTAGADLGPACGRHAMITGCCPRMNVMDRRARVVSCPIMAAGQRLSISFVLASLRALHIDNRTCPPAKSGTYRTTRKSTPQPIIPYSSRLLPAETPKTARTARQPAENYPQHSQRFPELIHSMK